MEQCSQVYSYSYRLTFGTKTIILSLAFVFLIKIAVVMLLECKRRSKLFKKATSYRIKEK